MREKRRIASLLAGGCAGSPADKADEDVRRSGYPLLRSRYGLMPYSICRIWRAGALLQHICENVAFAAHLGPN
ncbi:MAG: hypothetical protein Kow0088_09730 [Anaerolineales bacterium]